LAFPYIADKSDNSSAIVDKNKHVNDEFDDSKGSSAEGEDQEESLY
jgi:hypothetical protein